MFARKFHAAIVALTVVSLPAQSAQACGLWKSWFGTPATTFYAPYTAGPVVGESQSTPMNIGHYMIK